MPNLSNAINGRFQGYLTPRAPVPWPDPGSEETRWLGIFSEHIKPWFLSSTTCHERLQKRAVAAPDPRGSFGIRRKITYLLFSSASDPEDFLRAYFSKLFLLGTIQETQPPTLAFGICSHIVFIPTDDWSPVTSGGPMVCPPTFRRELK